MKRTILRVLYVLMILFGLFAIFTFMFISREGVLTKVALIAIACLLYTSDAADE